MIYMKRINNFQSYNEKLSPDTYRKVASELSHKGHSRRSKEMYDYANQYRGKYDKEILFKDNSVNDDKLKVKLNEPIISDFDFKENLIKKIDEYEEIMSYDAEDGKVIIPVRITISGNFFNDNENKYALKLKSKTNDTNEFNLLKITVYISASRDGFELDEQNGVYIGSCDNRPFTNNISPTLKPTNRKDAKYLKDIVLESVSQGGSVYEQIMDYTFVDKGMDFPIHLIKEAIQKLPINDFYYD